MVVGYMYFNQEAIIFHPKHIEKGYQFGYDFDFEEIFFDVDENIQLHGLLSKQDSSQGLIFYLHGNAGNCTALAGLNNVYSQFNYDVFVLDYRSYGKSNGELTDEEQFYEDAQFAYDEIKKRYAEENIIIIGFSVGTATAAWLASQNNPSKLILQAPYYSMLRMKDVNYSFIPDFVVNFEFETYKYLEHVRSPTYIFHGDRDETIHVSNAVDMEEFLKPGDQLIILEGQRHNGIDKNAEYQKHFRELVEGK
jgi:uncharacterized protein